MNSDKSELPPIAGSVPFIHNIDSGPAYWWQDILWVILASGDDTGGRFSLMYELMPKGSGPPPHKHTWSDETYYMLDGEITFLIGEEIKTARKGDFVTVPRDTRHGFRVDSETAEFLNGYTPASLEAGVIDLAMLAKQRVIPPKGVTPPTMMTPEQFRRYGMDFLPGPDPLRPDGR
ncbi:MAG: cupin domain-containing protein [Pyrinomonadaceae bacterium]